MRNIPFIPGGIDNLSRDSRSSRVTYHTAYGMIQAPTRKFTQFRMKNFKTQHSFFGKSFLFFFYCVLSRALLHHQETKTSSLSEQGNFRNTLS